MYTTVLVSVLNNVFVHVDHFSSITLWRKLVEIVLYRAIGVKTTNNCIFAEMYTSSHARFGINNVHHSLD